MIDKRRILDALLAEIETEIEKLLAAADATIEAATHEEAKPENDKDTRAIEASYLARGQAKRVEEANETLTRLRFVDFQTFGADDAIGPTALVRVEIDEGRREHLFLVPHGGGRTVTVDGTMIRAVSIASPVGRALMGKVTGDDFALTIAGKQREYMIESVA